MSRNQQRTLGEVWEALRAQRTAGKPEPAHPPSFLSVTEIQLWPEIFQHRRPSESASKAHIRELAKGAALPQELEPVLIWWDGKRWACIDGHHRLKAYAIAGKSGHDIAVQVFSGTPEEAIAEAARRNTRDKMAMGRSEKLGTAWRLVLTTKMSKADTVEASGVSDGTVAHMRRVRDKLTAQGLDVSSMNWRTARMTAAGEALEENVNWDERTEQEAQEFANKILLAIGKRAATRIEALARALEIFDARLPKLLTEEWLGRYGEAEDTDDEDDLEG